MPGVRFRVAARKNGFFSSQYMGNLKGPTFSSESANRSQSCWAENSQKRPFNKGQFMPVATVSVGSVVIGRGGVLQLMGQATRLREILITPGP